VTHNELNYEKDLLCPIDDFLSKHTGIKTDLGCYIKFPNGSFEIPSFIKNNIKKIVKLVLIFLFHVLEIIINNNNIF